MQVGFLPPDHLKKHKYAWNRSLFLYGGYMIISGNKTPIRPYMKYILKTRPIWQIFHGTDSRSYPQEFNKFQSSIINLGNKGPLKIFSWQPKILWQIVLLTEYYHPNFKFLRHPPMTRKSMHSVVDISLKIQYIFLHYYEVTFI